LRITNFQGQLSATWTRNRSDLRHCPYPKTLAIILKSSMNHSLTNTPTSNKPLRTILSWIIASILVIGVVFSFIDFKYVSTGGRILVLVSFLFGVIYSQVIKDLSKIERLFIFLMSFIQLIHFLFVINHWKGIFFTHLTLIIPIGLFVLITFRMNGKFKYEFPFLLVMATTALLSFI